MGTVKIHLVGANLYVPHTNGGSLLAVMPNATRLGKSSPDVADGSKPATHLPVIYEEQMTSKPFQLSLPRLFVGCRLSFDFGVASPLTLAPAVTAKSAAGWFGVPGTKLSTPPGDDVSGQVLVDRGTVTVFRNPVVADCQVRWTPADPGLSLDPVVLGLTVEVTGVSVFRATRTPWVAGASPLEIVNRLLAAGDTAEYYVGNFCAADLLGWPRNSKIDPATGTLSVDDDDFKWLLGLTPNPAIPAFQTTHGVLPAPRVLGGDIEVNTPVGQAFSTALPGGGAVGCECQGCIDQSQAF